MTISRHPLVMRFLVSLRKSHPSVGLVSPQWKLSVVLQALGEAPFEPIHSCPIKFLTWKFALLLAITSGRRVSELQALGFKPPYCTIRSRSAVLRTVPEFLPKISSAWHCAQVVELQSFYANPKSCLEHGFHKLCVLRCLKWYLKRTEHFRKSDRLFVLYGPNKKGQLASKASIARWVTSAIKEAYVRLGSPMDFSPKAHSTRKVAATWAEFAHCPLQEILRAALWSSHSTFVNFYKLDSNHDNFGSSVLVAGTSQIRKKSR